MTGNFARSASRPRAHDRDAVAVIGTSCRLPQAPSTEAFWRLLCDSVSAVSQVPADRWEPNALTGDDVPESVRAAARQGAYLDRLHGFSAEVLPSSPRRAAAKEPQRRVG